MSSMCSGLSGASSNAATIFFFLAINNKISRSCDLFQVNSDVHMKSTFSTKF